MDLGDMLSQEAYTKVAWVKREPEDNGNYNIISGNTGHALWVPSSNGYKLPQGMMVRGPLFKIMSPCQLGNGTLYL